MLFYVLHESRALAWRKTGNTSRHGSSMLCCVIIRITLQLHLGNLGNFGKKKLNNGVTALLEALAKALNLSFPPTWAGIVKAAVS